MRKDAVYRVRLPKKTLDTINRVAAAMGEDASEWGRAIIETELRRDLAALQLRDQLQAANPGNLSEDEARGLVNEAKRATRPMRSGRPSTARNGAMKGARASRGPSQSSLREIPEVDFATAKVRRAPYASRSATTAPSHARRGLDASPRKRRPPR